MKTIICRELFHETNGATSHLFSVRRGSARTSMGVEVRARTYRLFVPAESTQSAGGYLDRKNHPLGRHLITLGTVDSTLVSCREVFRGAIVAGCCALVVAHNHPSGDPAPSAADIHVTRKLRDAAKVIDIELLDHVIVGDAKGDPLHRGVYSFREAGLL